MRQKEHVNSLLQDAMRGARMEFRGNREVTVEDCRGILEYESHAVRIRTGRLVVRFTGRGLFVRSMTADSVVIEDCILGVEFLL